MYCCQVSLSDARAWEPTQNHKMIQETPAPSSICANRADWLQSQAHSAVLPTAWFTTTLIGLSWSKSVKIRESRP